MQSLPCFLFEGGERFGLVAGVLGVDELSQQKLPQLGPLLETTLGRQDRPKLGHVVLAHHAHLVLPLKINASSLKKEQNDRILRYMRFFTLHIM